MSLFDQRAGEWDSKPRRVKVAEDVAKGIIERGGFFNGASVIDVGTGTGLILLGLSELAGEMIGLDSSSGMLEVLAEKSEKIGIKNLKTQLFDMDKDELPDVKPDFVVASMLTHHLDRPEVFIQKAYNALPVGGKLCFADLVEEDGSFHDNPNEQVKHHGFSLSWAENILRETGFEVLDVSPVTSITKDKNGTEKEFPVFLAVAEKR